MILHDFDVHEVAVVIVEDEDRGHRLAVARG
jgi:hypothetical protein